MQLYETDKLLDNWEPVENIGKIKTAKVESFQL